MKRRDLLAISGCSVKKFDNLRVREHVPFNYASLNDPEGKQTDYSIVDAFQLRIFLDASENKGLPAEAATYIGGNCVRHLRNAHDPKMPDADLWIFYAQGRPYQFPDTGEFMTPRALGAGTLADLPAFVETKITDADNQFLVLINATFASTLILVGALKAGLIEDNGGTFGHIWSREYLTPNVE